MRAPRNFRVGKRPVLLWQSRYLPCQKCYWRMSQPVRLMPRPRSTSLTSWRNDARQVGLRSLPHIVMLWRSTQIALYTYSMGGPSMSEMLVQIHNGGRTYSHGSASVVALASATCTVMPGDRIALVGPSGSGKSTLLHLMGGLDTPTSGSLEWPALGAREALRPTKIGLVFQMPSLLAPLTVVENVEIPLLLG